MIVVLFFAATFAPLGRLVDIGARHMNGRIHHRAQARLERGQNVNHLNLLRCANLAGLVNFAIAGLFSQVVILCATLASIVLIVPLVGRFFWQMADVPVYAALLAGASAVYASFTVRYGVILFGLGFGITLLFVLV